MAGQLAVIRPKRNHTMNMKDESMELDKLFNQTQKN